MSPGGGLARSKWRLGFGVALVAHAWEWRLMEKKDVLVGESVP